MGIAQMWVYLKAGPTFVFSHEDFTGSTIRLHGCIRIPDPRFRPEHSSTYEPVKCNIDCNCDKKKMQCTYERQYAEMSSSSGLLAHEVISFGKESNLMPQHAIFGCENSESGDLFNQHADGIMGLGRGQLSMVDQLVEKGAISDSFSLCYGGMDLGGGAMVLGGILPPPGMVFAHSDPGRRNYGPWRFQGLVWQGNLAAGMTVDWTAASKSPEQDRTHWYAAHNKCMAWE
ncbi:Aspartic proteinase Asp1 [Platanthera zijinensis]|uniref:Aspartic proteinase Asp1 n=1 Tax=Platanthera zijinensis TaxID=2320716 RepID=A0AAP0BUT0_9ASPA